MLVYTSLANRNYQKKSKLFIYFFKNLSHILHVVSLVPINLIVYSFGNTLVLFNGYFSPVPIQKKKKRSFIVNESEYMSGKILSFF